MPPPSPPSSSTRSSPVATRRKAPSVSKAAAIANLPPPKSAHGPEKPSVLGFVVAAVVSLVAEGLAHEAASIYNTGELARISKRDATWYEIGGLLTWKITLLATCWFGGLDAVDVASLNALLETPKFILLHYFYLISSFELVTKSTISILAKALPFYIMRPLSAPHAASDTTKATAKLRNRTIINDPITTIATSAMATLAYAVTLQLAFSFFLPSFLITHFSPLPSLEWAYNVATTFPTLLMWLAPAGIASTQFLFRPSEGAASSSNAATGPNSIALTHSHFDPATASFVQHIYHNVWGWYTSRQKELIGRTIVLGAFLLTETVVQLCGEVQGVELLGAAGYASTWLVGAITLGVVLEWVGRPSD
ncbi:hypothetical protein PMZ80_010618 [Knufia obscura]|nr:hypothetical protein PMZ80_010618 [Knufia obscura]